MESISQLTGIFQLSVFYPDQWPGHYNSRQVPSSPPLLLFPFIVPQLKGTQPQLKGWGTDGRKSGMCAIFGERVHYRGRMEGSGGEPQCASDSAYYYTS